MYTVQPRHKHVDFYGNTNTQGYRVLHAGKTIIGFAGTIQTALELIHSDHTDRGYISQPTYEVDTDKIANQE